MAGAGMAEDVDTVTDIVDNQNLSQNENAVKSTKKKRIGKISEKLNDDESLWGFNIFADSRQMLPGMVVYVIDKIEPTDAVPYVTYKPAMRIITEIQDNGVNNGTVFLSYTHKIAPISTYHSVQHNKPRVVSENDVIYSPLTKEHAEYVCKLLNLQSKQMYMAALKQTTHTK